MINSVPVIQRVINHSPSRRSLRRTLTFSIFPSKAPSSAESPKKTLCQLKWLGQYISSILYAVVNIHRRNVVRCATSLIQKRSAQFCKSHHIFRKGTLYTAAYMTERCTSFWSWETLKAWKCGPNFFEKSNLECWQREKHQKMINDFLPQKNVHPEKAKSHKGKEKWKVGATFLISLKH